MASKKYDYLKRTDRGTLVDPEVLWQGPNARTSFDPEKLAELKEQIRQEGVLQPLIVKRAENDNGGKLKIFDGERRSRCVRELREEGHEIEWVPVIIRQASDADLMVEAAMTDTGKVGLDFADQTRLIRMLVGYGFSVEEIATRLGKSGTWVRQRQDLAMLEPSVLNALRDKEITLTKGLKLAKKDADKQLEALEKVRARRKKGEKKAGSVKATKPGKKQIRKLADDALRDGSYYSAGQVDTLLRWVMGEVDDKTVHNALKPLTKVDVSEPTEQPQP